MKKKNIKKVRNGKKRISINELNLIQEAYFKKLTFADYFKFLGIPAIAFGAITHVLQFYVPATIAAAVFGICFGLFKQMPKMIKKNYFLRSYVERNRFLNNFTQLIVNENITLLDIIEKIIPRLSGELYNDMTVLLARISTSDNQMAREAFKELANKYHEDVVFSQYVEQIETVFLEGYRSVESFKELKNQHNVLLEKIKDFQKDKGTTFTNFIGILTLVGLLVGILIFGRGVDLYITAYAHTGMGAISNTAYLVLLFFMYNKLMNYVYDDSITTL